MAANTARNAAIKEGGRSGEGCAVYFLARREITVREGGWVTDTILRCRVRNARQPLKNRAESAVRIVITAREPSFPQTFENPPYFSTRFFLFSRSCRDLCNREKRVEYRWAVKIV